jgi:hypothetical protein
LQYAYAKIHKINGIDIIMIDYNAIRAATQNVFTNINIENLMLTIQTIQNKVPQLASAKPLPYERALWLVIKEAIKPHLDGAMPLLVEDAFDAEKNSQKANRRKLYRSESGYLLAQSIQDVYKIVQSDDFLIDYDKELDDICSRTFFGGARVDKNIVKKMFSTIYLDRVRDANAHIGIVPYNYGDGEGKKQYELKLYPSENIVIKSRECMVFAIGHNMFRVYTLNATFVADGNGMLISTVFAHNNNDLGCYILGGAPRNVEINVPTNNPTNLGSVTEVIEVQFSDYSFATDKMDKLETRNSQNEVVTVLHTHPRMVARDLDCNECDGVGTIEAKDSNGVALNQIINKGTDSEYPVPIRHTCPTCKGKKVIELGTQDIINVPMPTYADPAEAATQNISDLAKSIIAYVSPDITSATFLYEQLKDNVNEVKEMLHLQDVEKFNESGAAKRIDQEAGQPRLRAVAEGMQTLIYNILKGLVNFEFVVGAFDSRKTNAIAAIRVSIPTFFDLLTVSQSKDNYFANLPQKPISERYTERLNIIKKQYNDPREIAIFKIAAAYTKGANLLLLEELTTNVSIGVLTEFDVYLAQFIETIIRFDVLLPAAERGLPIDLINTTQADVFKLIEEAVQPYKDKQLAAKVAGIGDLPMD